MKLPKIAMETATNNSDIALGSHRDLLDIIDSLRLHGVSHYVDLPQIIVCGDQSAGKSSVLEAISKMPFPVKDGLCTRFATELVLRRGPTVPPKVSIIPGENRYGEDKERLENWQPVARIDDEGLGAVTLEAKAAMAEGAAAGDFYEDILRIELAGPGQPHLTMVDLPGLFRRGNKDQSDDDVGLVRSMVKKYMARPRSIILTVVSAKYDYVLQEVTSMAKSADPEGRRTMGLITKPDDPAVGSPTENYYFRLAKNLEEPLRLGWHVLRNRSFEERNVSSDERDKIEKEFFSKGVWATLDRSQCGAKALGTRLSALLKDQILTELPSLVRDVENNLEECEAGLKRLGPLRGTPDEQQSYLTQVSEDYTLLMAQAVDGTYTNPFFGNRKKIDKYQARLRAVVRNLLDEFAEDMQLRGKSQSIEDSESEIEGDHKTSTSPSIKRTEYVQDVTERLKYSRGRELAGLFNPLVVCDLFVAQCEPWGGIARVLADHIFDAVLQTTEMIVQHITAGDVFEGTLKIIRRGIDELKVELDTKIDTLLASVAQDTITYNRQLTENVEKTQEGRYKRQMTKMIRKSFGWDRFLDSNDKIKVNPIEFLNLFLKHGSKNNLDRYGSALAVDYMEAYYEVAVVRFIDDVSVLAVEDCLISKLSTLFRPSHVLKMSQEELHQLAGDTEQSFLERQGLLAKREVLGKGLQSLKSLNNRRNAINPSRQNHGGLEESFQASEVTPGVSDRASEARKIPLLVPKPLIWPPASPESDPDEEPKSVSSAPESVSEAPEPEEEEALDDDDRIYPPAHVRLY